jgi:AAA+ superfamily predicted ATPase
MRRDDSGKPAVHSTGAQRDALERAAMHARKWLRSQQQEPPVQHGPESDRPGVLLAGADREQASRTAQQLARALGRELYRVDLGSLVSKFMAETEKNLGRALETAERTGAVLLFDESDALFGDRSARTALADRYASVDIDYMERRLAAFHGVAILACRSSLPELGSAAQRFGCVIELEPPRPR